MTKNEFTKIVEKLVQISPRWESVTGIEVVPLYDVMETLRLYVDGEEIEEKPYPIYEEEVLCPFHSSCANWSSILQRCSIGMINCDDHGYYSRYEKK